MKHNAVKDCQKEEGRKGMTGEGFKEVGQEEEMNWQEGQEVK